MSSQSRVSRQPCRFYQAGNCRYGQKCRFEHGIARSGLGASNTTSPTGLNSPNRSVTLSTARNSDLECNICLKQPRSFALLECCSHVFCVSCILEWRKTKRATSNNTTPNDGSTKCPLCQVDSAFFVSSSTFYKDGPEKSALIQKYKDTFCGICYEKPRAYALLSECSHLFCVPCMNSCGGEEMLGLYPTISVGDSYKCPFCRVISSYFVPSIGFLKAGHQKSALLQRHTERKCAVCQQRPTSFSILDCCPVVICSPCMQKPKDAITHAGRCPGCNSLRPISVKSFSYCGNGSSKQAMMRSTKATLATRPCRMFLNSNCRYGDNCRYMHTPPSPPPREYSGWTSYTRTPVIPATSNSRNTQRPTNEAPTISIVAPSSRRRDTTNVFMPTVNVGSAYDLEPTRYRYINYEGATLPGRSVSRTQMPSFRTLTQPRSTAAQPNVRRAESSDWLVRTVATIADYIGSLFRAR